MPAVSWPWVRIRPSPCCPSPRQARAQLGSARSAVARRSPGCRARAASSLPRFGSGVERRVRPRLSPRQMVRAVPPPVCSSEFRRRGLGPRAYVSSSLSCSQTDFMPRQTGLLGPTGHISQSVGRLPLCAVALSSLHPRPDRKAITGIRSVFGTQENSLGDQGANSPCGQFFESCPVAQSSSNRCLKASQRSSRPVDEPNSSTAASAAAALALRQIAASLGRAAARAEWAEALADQAAHHE